jgi:membrane fusion protein (multidrug efflux system)
MAKIFYGTKAMTSDTPRKSNKAITWIVLLLIFIVTIAGIIWYLRQSNLYPSTDDTYVQAHIVDIAPQVSGPVTQVFVKDHQEVKQGQLLFSIDPRPFQYAEQRAEAQLKLAQQQGARIFPLIAGKKEPPAEGDKIKAQIQEAMASLSQARYDLQNTMVTAPAAGIIANFKVRVGDSVATSINLFAIVEQHDFWINANFKETQLKRIKVGQSADIKVDMYPGVKFKGVVASMSPGTGTIFSLLPPENATGNWVKVTQRVPVKINFVNPNPAYPLITGTSAEATVDTVNSH